MRVFNIYLSEICWGGLLLWNVSAGCFTVLRISWDDCFLESALFFWLEHLLYVPPSSGDYFIRTNCWLFVFKPVSCLCVSSVWLNVFSCGARWSTGYDSLSSSIQTVCRCKVSAASRQWGIHSVIFCPPHECILYSSCSLFCVFEYFSVLSSSSVVLFTVDVWSDFVKRPVAIL